MLRVCCPSRRHILQPCLAKLPSASCQLSSNQPENPTRRTSRIRTTGGNGSTHQAAIIRASVPSSDTPRGNSNKPSLIEQLFPEESKRYEEQQRALAEVPRLPLESPVVERSQRRSAARENAFETKSYAARQLQRQVEATGEVTSVLVLRNASNNLTEEDFRRLIPQGRHIEGWTLEQGDIVKVIPGRDLTTLAQQNIYYLLFSSALSAFTYQGHATRIHKLSALHTPKSSSSPIPPPPGYMMEGLDVHSALEAYALVPPTQRLELRQLKPPLSPFMQSVVRHQGIPALLKREGKMPFEARLTMEGTQLALSTLRHIMRETGRSRALNWSGGDNANLSITRWEPVRARSAHDVTNNAQKEFEGQIRSENVLQEAPLSTQTNPISDRTSHRTRPAPAIYIVGFHTENAAQTFVRYWHRRPLELAGGKGTEEAEDDLAPIANVELLW